MLTIQALEALSTHALAHLHEVWVHELGAPRKLGTILQPKVQPLCSASNAATRTRQTTTGNILSW